MLLVILELVFFDSLIEKKRLGVYGFKKPKKTDIKLAFIVFSMFFPISIASRVLFPAFDFLYANLLRLNYSNVLQFLTFLIPIGVFTEEIGTRALFQSKLSPIFSNRLAIYATIINFTFLHFGWFFSLNLTNFLIIFFTVFAYSIFLAFLFDYTKSIFSTIVVHMLLNTASSLQILFHINNQIFYEVVLWSAWGICFVLLFPPAIAFLKKAFTSSTEKKMKNLWNKLLLILLSIFSVLTILFVRFVL